MHRLVKLLEEEIQKPDDTWNAYTIGGSRAIKKFARRLLEYIKNTYGKDDEK